MERISGQVIEENLAVVTSNLGVTVQEVKEAIEAKRRGDLSQIDALRAKVDNFNSASENNDSLGVGKSLTIIDVLGQILDKRKKKSK